MALTVCPLSNLRLRVVDSLVDHPLRRMMDKGLIVTVNSDDPAYFGGYVNDNYLAISDALLLQRGEIIAIARNGIEASLMKTADKTKLLVEFDRSLDD
jgi:adenosine deaminase